MSRFSRHAVRVDWWGKLDTKYIMKYCSELRRRSGRLPPITCAIFYRKVGMILNLKTTKTNKYNLCSNYLLDTGANVAILEPIVEYYRLIQQDTQSVILQQAKRTKKTLSEKNTQDSKSDICMTTLLFF